jgi:hypothetical protein
VPDRDYFFILWEHVALQAVKMTYCRLPDPRDSPSRSHTWVMAGSIALR